MPRLRRARRLGERYARRCPRCGRFHGDKDGYCYRCRVAYRAQAQTEREQVSPWDPVELARQLAET